MLLVRPAYPTCLSRWGHKNTQTHKRSLNPRQSFALPLFGACSGHLTLGMCVGGGGVDSVSTPPPLPSHGRQDTRNRSFPHIARTPRSPRWHPTLCYSLRSHSGGRRKHTMGGTTGPRPPLVAKRLMLIGGMRHVGFSSQSVGVNDIVDVCGRRTL